MTAILTITLPVYLIIALGYLTVRIGYTSRATIGALSQFTIRICLPALIFSALTSSQSANALNWSIILGYIAASLTTLVIGFGLMRRGFAQEPPVSWIHGLGMSNSNSGFFGFAIASMVFPDAALQVLAWIMIAENAVIIPLAVTAAEVAAGGSAPIAETVARAVRSFVRNPLVLAIAAALTIRGMGAPLPAPVVQTITMLAAVAPAVALFVVGGIVAQFSISPFWRRTAVIAFGKLLLHPALVFLVLETWSGADGDLVPAAVLFAAVPMLSIYPILGAKYGAEQVCATAFIVTTAGSFLTVSALVWGMKVFGAGQFPM